MRPPFITAPGQAIGCLYRYWVLDSIGHLRRGGPRELIRQRGWRFVLVLVAYYLVRDTLLYIVLPLLAARGLLAD